MPRDALMPDFDIGGTIQIPPGCDIEVEGDDE